MATLTVSNIKAFTDLDLDFDVHPNTKKLNILQGDAAVIRAVRNLISTNHYERLFHPEIGCNVRAMLFENIQQSTALGIRTAITECLTNFEPRIELSRVDVTAVPDQNGYAVGVEFFIVNQTTARTLEFFLERIR